MILHTMAKIPLAVSQRASHGSCQLASVPMVQVPTPCSRSCPPTTPASICHTPIPAVQASSAVRSQATAIAAVAEPGAVTQRLPDAAGCASLLCTIATAPTVSEAVAQIRQAASSGATAIEIRLDFYQDLDPVTPGEQIKQLVEACQRSALVSIFTCRAAWEGGKFSGSEDARLTMLQQAAAAGANHIDVELKAAATFFQDYSAEHSAACKVILSHHNFQSTPDDAELDSTIQAMFAAGAQVAKVATTAEDITDAMRVLAAIRRAPGPTIALAMGERGVISRLLAPKYGGYLTFGALEQGKGSAPGQPTVESMCSLFSLPTQTASTKVYGIVGNPVSHSRSPLLHNNGFHRVGHDAVYVPLLVDDLARTLRHPLAQDISGLSITIPHKEAASRVADEVDPTAAQIGAVNTLIRDPRSARLSAYNTDWSAAVVAIEDGLRGSAGGQVGGNGQAPDRASPLSGRKVVVLGAGGAARALVLGAMAAGAQVVIVNRNRARAEVLAESAGSKCTVADLSDLVSGVLKGDVLVQTTSVGMHPDVDDTPLPHKSALKGFVLVFDAIYTPLHTRLLKDAQDMGCTVVSGVEMFVGQALQQFRLFTGQDAPPGLFRRLVLDGLNH